MRSFADTVLYYGGSFRPPTIAHILMCRYVVETLAPKALRLLPTRTPPHKHPGELPDAAHLAMIRHTFAEVPGVEIEAIEYGLDGPSYTARTLALLAREGEDMAFLMGMDAYNTFVDWADPERILEFAHIVVLARGGVVRKDHELFRRFPDRFTFLENPEFSMSSSWVREQIAKRRDLRFFLSDATLSWIETHGYWREYVHEREGD